jgi:hypothetical protein
MLLSSQPPEILFLSTQYPHRTIQTYDRLDFCVYSYYLAGVVTRQRGQPIASCIPASTTIDTPSD